jgi:two-component system, NtrC family, C4-dicarboxylate transport sensor histidine kinase DctB
MIFALYEKEAFKHIQQTLNFEKAIQDYIADYQKPAVRELLENRSESQDFFDPRLLSSTYIAHKIFKNYNEGIGEDSGLSRVYLRVISDNPTNLNNMADSYEASILNKMRNNEIQSHTEYITRKGKRHLFYAEATKKNDARCLQCHGNPQDAPSQLLEKYGPEHGFYEKEGDLHAIVAVYEPIDVDQKNMYYGFISIAVLSLLVFTTIFLIIFYYAKKIMQKDQLIAKQSKFAAMGEMIGMIAHQWRQPLTGIGMTVDNLKLDIELETIDEQQWGENLDLIKAQIHYLSHTIDDFRNFFKPNQQPQEINIGRFLDETLQIAATHLDQKGIVVQKVYDESVRARTFRNDLMQVVLNLIKNASDAITENEIKDAEIRVACKAEKGWIEIEVSDNAGGIPAEIIEKIYDPYFSTKDEKNGTGLGLYMSKMIVEDHLQGSLELITDNKGSSFIIKIKEEVHVNGN